MAETIGISALSLPRGCEKAEITKKGEIKSVKLIKSLFYPRLIFIFK